MKDLNPSERLAHLERVYQQIHGQLAQAIDNRDDAVSRVELLAETLDALAWALDMARRATK